MLKNYLLVTFRNLLKNRVFTLINILGLGIALSVCIVAFFNHMFNYEFDRSHLNFDKIYRINSFRDMEGRDQEHGIVPATLGLQVKKDIPGIEKAARLMRTRSPVKEGLDIFPTQITYADPEFLDIFTFPILLGDKKSIENQANVIVSRTMADKLFGKEYPIGKSIVIVNDKNREFAYTVGAVFEDLPLNSSFRIDILSHYDNFKLMWEWNDADWKNFTTCLFVEVPDKSLIPSITKSLSNYIACSEPGKARFQDNQIYTCPFEGCGLEQQDYLGLGTISVPSSCSIDGSSHYGSFYTVDSMLQFCKYIDCYL